MKHIALVALVLALVGSLTAQEPSSLLPVSKTNLTRLEIQSLTAGTTFKDIEKRLRYFTRCEIAIPLISFEIEGEKEQDCVMLFDEKYEHLWYAWISPQDSKPKDEAVILWPRKHAGEKFSSIEVEVGKKLRANQRPQGTPGKAPSSSTEPDSRRP